MRSGILIVFLGIIFSTKCLDTGPSSNGFRGEYFSNVGTYNFVDSKDMTLVKDYSLTDLENVFGNAEKHPEIKLLPEVGKLEKNLNGIYKICHKNRTDLLPYIIKPIPESQLKENIDKALKDSDVILSELVALASLNYTESLGVKEKMNKTNKYNGYNYLYPKHVKDFEVAKKYINFYFNLEKLINHQVFADVKMEVPLLVKSDLYRIYYVPYLNPDSKEVELILDQSISNLVVTAQFADFFLIKNMDSCKLINDTFLCDPEQTERVQARHLSCASFLFEPKCLWKNGNRCTFLEGSCSYKEALSEYKEFTYVGDNKFYVFLTREANYIYECDDGRREEGKFMFESLKDHHYSGTVVIEENCILRTAHTTIFNKNGFYETQIIDNEELIWADVPKIIGIRKWIFYVSVAAISLIIVMILITWIFICVRHCKAEKAKQYITVKTSG
ncbi:hypothetical protein ACFFRR_006780 [Megaselia abdita]